MTNLGSYNFYNFNSNEQIKEKAIQVLRTYGVGPCGPPQFYGTQDVHMKTEADIASYIGTESCIVYAQAFSTISSVIPAFCKRGDIIVADRAVNFSIRRGLQISRSNIKWFNHGDMDDLERVMRRVASEQSQKKLTRRFIVTEGLFETVGDCVNLPKLVSRAGKTGAWVSMLCGGLRSRAGRDPVVTLLLSQPLLCQSPSPRCPLAVPRLGVF